MTIKIWLGDLSAYNEGRLAGEWVALPCDEETLDALVSKYTNDGQSDYYIADYEAPFQHNSFVHLTPQRLNEIAEELADMNEYDLARVEYLAEARDIDTALSDYEDVSFYEGMTLKQVAMELVDEGVFGDVPETIANYIDYEAIARDLSFDGYEETARGVFHYNG